MAWSRLLALVFSGLCCATTLNGINAINQTTCCGDAQNATTFAYIYGAPFIAYMNYSSTFFSKGGVGTNAVARSAGLATPANTSVHHPNPDCTFSDILIDLSSHDLVLTVPVFQDNRFWAFSFFDPYGSNFATLSNELHSAPGKYLIRQAEDVHKSWGVGKGNGSYQGYINFPTTHGLMLNRILALNDTTDIPVASHYEDEVSVEQVPRYPENLFVAPSPALTANILNVSQVSSMPLQALTLLARLGFYNQPIVEPDRYRVGANLAQAGINFVTSNFSPAPGVNFTAAVKAAFETVEQDKTGRKELSNGWAIQDPLTAGIFYSDYAERAGAALVGYLGDTSNININPGYKSLPGPQILAANKAYLLTFHGKVPVIPEFGGFWSVTAYLADGNLIPNAINRYTIGIRDNITYPDGTPVYARATNNGTAIGTLAASEVEPDKTFQLLLQAAAPPSNWTSNWLPMSSNGSSSEFKMRVYAPADASRNGSYKYPTVQTIDAIAE